MPSTLSAADTALASSLRISVMRLTRRLRAERASTGLSLSQLAALASIDRHGPLTPGELAVHERVQPPSMTRIVGVLEGLGYVTRTAHATDRRQAVLEVTPAGAALLREDRRRREAWLARALTGLSAEERAVLADAAPLLERLAAS